ncbi:hypothetical protein PG988_012101 [Apiospora saccharicola]
MASRTPEKTGTMRKNVCSTPPPVESTTTDRGTEGIPAAAATSPGACRLLYLPPEILLSILELTDLVVPNGEVYWNPVDLYHLPPRATIGTTWKPPTALFLVNKALSAVTRTVFLGRNRMSVRPNYAGFYEIRENARQANTPQLYGAKEFFTQAVGAVHLPSLRNLEFHLSPMIDREVAAEARQDWFGVLDQINPDGEGGGLSLRILSISGDWENNEEGRAWMGASKESGIDRVRQFIRDNVWGFVSPDGPPLGIVQQLWVELRTDMTQSRYSIRKKGQDKANAAYWDCDWGNLRQSRAFAWRKSDVPVLNNSSSGSQAGDWVEELWVKEHHSIHWRSN